MKTKKITSSKPPGYMAQLTPYLNNFLRLDGPTLYTPHQLNIIPIKGQYKLTLDPRATSLSKIVFFRFKFNKIPIAITP